MVRAGWLFVAVWAALCGRGTAREGMAVVGARVEGLTAPMGVEEPRPALSWEVVSGRRGDRQTAYRVLVASSPEALARDEGDLWDSGRVASGATFGVGYAGAALASRERCWWKVMAWDRDGRAGAWSDGAVWEMGLLSPADWSAAWVEAGAGDGSGDGRAFVVRSAVYGAGDVPEVGERGADVTERVAGLFAGASSFKVTNEAMGGDPVFGQRKRLVVWGELGGRPVRIEEPEGSVARAPTGTIPLLRRSFVVKGAVRRARVYATALGVYELSLDGEKVGDQSLAPGWTDYRERVRYQVYDVTDRLAGGEHALGAVVGPGWFAGHAGLFGAYGFYGATPALRVQLEIEYEDGTTQRVTTDDEWRRADGPWAWGDLFDGEVYDARRAIPGWDTPGFDDSGWARATTRAETRNLEADVCQPVRTLAELPAVGLTEPAPGRWTFDLGQNMVGVARLRLEQPAGTVVTLRYGEMLNPDGTVYTANLRAAPSTDVYVCRGGGVETWRPRFTFHGFRYVEVTGLATAPVPDAVTGVVLGTDTPVAGSFACSDERINRLQSNIVWGMRGNYLSVPTDCPQRDERMGWMADAQVFAPTALMNADAGPFMRKWLADVRDAQREDGAFSDVSPATFGLNYGSPAWADAGTVVPWAVYEETGDLRVLGRNIDAMAAWVDWCEAHSTGLIRDRDRGNDYGDWLSIGADTSKELIGTAYFAHAADTVARAMDALGRAGDAARYRGLFGRVRRAFNDRYVHADGSIEGDTQTAYVLALRFGLLDEPVRSGAVGRLVADVEGRGWRLSTGFVGVSHLLGVLDGAGRADVAERLLMQNEFPSWLFSVKHGATTVWERWDGWTPETGPHPDVSMNSFNHYSLGSCGRWLYEGVAGLRPAEAGWGRAEIRPAATGALSWARARHHSVRGWFGSSWRREGGMFTLEAEVPANAEAEVWVPAGRGDRVTESGAALGSAEGVTVLERDASGVRVRVGSGVYRFRVERGG